MGDVEIMRSASLSDCARYRYSLARQWDASRRCVLFVMLNPSTADASVDDATIRSCMRLARSWGYGGILVVNLFAWRATDPRELSKADEPVGALNNHAIRTAVIGSDITICAWGAHAMAQDRAKEVLPIIQEFAGYTACLGKTKSGAPKHPLYIKTGTAPEMYP